VARRAAGLTQDQAAEQLAVTRQTVSGWERGEHPPSLVQTMQMMRLYKVSADHLLAGVESVPVKGLLEAIFSRAPTPTKERQAS
jgi:transcriptional regulator with XRE-family HTH domain